jgi:hypothetical protein
MTHKETVERNIGLTFDFVNYLIDNKSEIEKLPDNFNLKFIEKDFPKRQYQQKDDKEPFLIERYVRVKNSFAIA